MLAIAKAADSSTLSQRQRTKGCNRIRPRTDAIISWATRYPTWEARAYARSLVSRLAYTLSDADADTDADDGETNDGLGKPWSLPGERMKASVAGLQPGTVPIASM